jgi:hypothetical protein
MFSCAPSTHLLTNFLCLLADPLGVECPPLDIPVAARICCLLDIMAATTHFLHCVCPTPFPPPPPLPPVHACSTPSSVDSTTTMDSLACSHVSDPSFLLDSPSATPRLLSPSHPSCPSPQVPCVFGASDPVSDGEVPIAFLHVLLPPGNLLLMLRPPRLQTVMTKFPFRVFHTALLWFRVMVMRSLFHTLCFLVSPPLPVP